MRIVGLGNCQVKAITGAMRVTHPSATVAWFSNSDRVAPIDLAGFLQAAETADAVILQPILNAQNPLALSRLMQVIPRRKMVVVPYVYLDGLFCMTLAPHAPQRPYGLVLGGDSIEAELQRHTLDEVLRRFRDGKIDFRIRDRLATTWAELKRREAACDVTILPVIEQHVRRAVVMVTNNHPSIPMMQAMVRRICRHLGLHVPVGEDWKPEARKALKLSVPCTVVTPHDAEILGFTYEIAPSWKQDGERLIRLIAEDLATQAAAA